MPSKIKFNHYYKYSENGVFQLKLNGSHQEESLTAHNEVLWDFLTQNNIIKDIVMECVWIFFLEENDTIKGFSKINLIEFNSMTGIETLRLILMADVKKVVFAIHLGENKDISNFPPKATKFYQNMLRPLRIEVCDTIVVTDETYDSLKENSLL